MDFEKFVQKIIESEETEPFCPFGSKWFGCGYCDCAYSESCYSCKYAHDAYNERNDAN